MTTIIPQRQCRDCEQFKPATKDFFTAVPAYISPDLLNRQCKECRNTQRKKAQKRIKPQEGYRRCSLCKQEKPETVEHFYPSTGHKNGLSYVCRDCRKGYVQSLAEKRSPVLEKYQKQCASCQMWKPANDFIKHPTTHDGLNAICKDCVNAYGRQYGKANRSRLSAQATLHRQTPEGKMRESARYHNRRARKKSNGGTYTAQDIADQLKRQHSTCYYCGNKFGKGPHAYHVDHIVPLTRGGSNWPDNLVLACRSCNSSKGNKLLHEWLYGGRLL